MKRLFTVWKFTAAWSGETVVVARVAEPNDRQVQHEYQQVLRQVMAFNATEALAA